jgi:NTE family protein
MTTTSETCDTKLALILSGGGARAAYQVGVLKALAEIIPRHTVNPFGILCGTSAGSINATVLAANAHDFHCGVEQINDVWSNFTLDQVFRSDLKSLLGRVIKWFWSTVGPGDDTNGPQSILDNSPLKRLLRQRIDFSAISVAINSGHLDALCINACSYTTGRSISFFQSSGDLSGWERAHREGRYDNITIEHLTASSSLPLIFPPVKLDNEYFGDGSMRQNAPISPALHLGARRILIIGVRMEPRADQEPAESERGVPTVGQIAGYIMDTLFLNSLYSDIERLERINEAIDVTPDAAIEENMNLDQVDHYVISPSTDLAELSHAHFMELPRTFRYAIRLLGMHKGNSRRFISYLMFNKGFCRDLIEEGYRDAMNQRKPLMEFLDC